MSPSSDPANAATEEAMFPVSLLEDGEVVVLAIKPSGWFILVVSFPVLAAVGLVAGGLYLGQEVFHVIAPQRAMLLLCAVAASLRVIIACFQWLGRLYILTNKRAISVRGVVRAEVLGCPLRQIADVLLEGSAFERLWHVGSLYFEVSEGGPAEFRWTCIANPGEVHQTVLQAIRRSK